MTPQLEFIRRALLPLDAVTRCVADDANVYNPAVFAEFESLPLKSAAVLVPIIARAGEPTLLFTRRSDTLTRHAGQIAFPGGRTDPDDRSALDTALRECEEEIGLDPSAVTILGALNRHVAGTGYLITPVVGWIEPPFDLRPDPGEVAEIFEAPLSFVLDRANHTHGVTNFKGRERGYTAMLYGEHRIWGVTASILVNLCERIENADGGHP